MARPKPQAPDPQYEYQKTLHSAYKELRSEADQIALEIGGRYEKMLSLVAGGALAVSITFIEKIAPTPVPWSRWVALIAWILLGGAIVATLIAISGSQRAQQKKIENMDSEVLQRLYPDDPRYKDLDVTANPFTNRVHWANAVSLYCAVAGLLSLIFFVFINFPSPKKHEQQEPTKPAATAAAGQHTEDKLLRADEKPSSPATAPVTPATTIQKREVTMPTQPNPPPANPPVPQPSKGTGPLTESYVPTKNPVAPPTPPQNPTAPVKDGK